MQCRNIRRNENKGEYERDKKDEQSDVLFHTFTLARYTFAMRVRGLLRIIATMCATLALAAAAYAMQAARTPQAAAPPTKEVNESIYLSYATTTPNTYFVAKVVDGDTDDVVIDGKIVRLRLIGMDTPEVVDPRKPVQCFGREASAEGHALLDGQWVRLAYDTATGKTDIYGRTLAYVYRASDGLFYNEFMVRQGFAHEYDYDNQKYEYRAEFQAAQAAAKQAQIGFWSPSTCDGDTTKPAGAS